ncbi:MAG: glycoside hydrolase family 3 C-terminal domain-containing protein [Bacteroidetes bacterium]|nr:glycoside hydrolase family 3 C-terminal domain-containing protein [Bacteroidota bacterium]
MRWFLLVTAALGLACAESPTAAPEPPTALTLDERVDSLVALMTLDEKIGQMTQAERSRGSIELDIRTYTLGSLLSGGGSAPADNSPGGWADMYDRYQQAALQTRLRIPLIYGIDAVHGHNNVRGAVIMPHNIGLGCTNDAALVEEVGRVVAREVAGTGIDWTFAPCIAVPRDERWGRTYEGFGETPDLTWTMAGAAVRGLQGTDVRGGERIVACAKHFLGDGGTTGGDDQGNTQLDELTMRGLHLPGYLAAVQAGVGTVMASYSSWNGQKMHGSRYWLTDVLKVELGFKGFVVSDWQGVDQLPGGYEAAVETAINAGIDMVMVPINIELFISSLRRLVNANRVPMSRIDDAVRRILRVKFQMGLFERTFTDRALTLAVGSAAHRAVARQAVRKSIVLLKNDSSFLPLSKSLTRIHVAGKNADDLGNQCGGWTITWQGQSGAITTGTTILQGIRDAVSANTSVTYSRDGSGAAGADVAIVVLGETPYAEMLGDRSDLNLTSEDLTTFTRVRATGVPTVLVLVSGRPMIVTDIAYASNAFLAAWLPGTEGAGVADVLFGDYHPTGILSHSWPRAMNQVPVNVGDPYYDPLFPVGFGLHYE